MPARLRARAVVLYAVSLRDDESPQMFGEKILWPLEAGEIELLRQVAAGVPTRTIASQTGVSMRTVQRQIARLRRRLKLSGNAELRQYLRDRGIDVDAG
jgi:DNA-binding NarL/FixJ family response regulator